ncbi:hypothetical protein CPB83DRAFT_784026 [Crepidotus variabilis]|uniref:RING-type E3 ubiquitin transferase n=1 Tax=Crepidotus variabilis TaxID=179855 RepID=A0A9P6EPW6_9AGAR|nr:hypothetical protein CPB83DRAFT_784026 [Crepidotus variabilis]
MSTQVATQTANSGPNQGSAKRGNRGRGGRNNRNNRQPRDAGYKGKPSQDQVAEVVGETSTLTLEPADKVSEVAEPAASESGEGDVCWICAEQIKYFAISECNHRTCHVCALRLRALYKKMDCTFCKEKQNAVIFTTSPDALFASFEPASIPHKDAKLSIYFESQEMMEDSLLLLRFNCPERDCDYIGNGWGDLRLHVRATHAKLMCDICIRHKKVFSHEHALYPPGTLPVHLPSMFGRPSKSALKEPPEGGIHPLCEFCRECFFSDDELYSHMRERHEECFICKRNGIVHQYFSNYDALEKHFNNDHYPCNQTECLVRKFVVFNTPIDLKAHMVEDHGADMSSKDRKDARRIEANFAFEDVGRRGGREREREREREPPPHQRQQQQQQHTQTTQASASSNTPGKPPPAQPQQTGSRRRDGFGGALTETAGGSSTPPNNGARTPRPPSPDGGADADPAVAERHANFLARLQSLAPNPTAAVPSVKSAIRSYRANESTARDLILTIWNVLDCNLEQTASIVNAFVDLVDDDEKKQDILGSWKGFAVEQRRQFPDLAPATVGSGYAGITSGRVLNAKHATASRSSHAVWNRVAQAASNEASSSSNPPPRPTKPQERFPALGGAASNVPGSAPAGKKGGQRNTPWSASSGAPTFRPQTTPSASSTPTPAISSTNFRTPNTNSKKPPKLSSSLFPELPTSNAARSKPQVSGNVSLKNILGSTGPPSVKAWRSGDGGSTSGGVSTTETPSENVESVVRSGGSGEGKGKKLKGKQKQTLFTLGAFPS